MKPTHRARTMVLLVLAFALGSLIAGCGKGQGENGNSYVSGGDADLAQGRPDVAYDQYKRALDHANKIRKKAQTSVVEPLEARLAGARAVCTELAKKKVVEARVLAAIDPDEALARLEDARRLAGSRYANDAETLAAAVEVDRMPELFAARARRQMDLVTDRINGWLFSRSSSDWGSYWSAQSYMDMLTSFSDLDAVLGQWSASSDPVAAIGVRAQGQFLAMRTAFTTWRAAAMLEGGPGRASSTSLWRFLQSYTTLRATLQGRRDLDWRALQGNWGINQNGSWSGTSDGGTGTRPVVAGETGTGQGTVSSSQTRTTAGMGSRPATASTRTNTFASASGDGEDPFGDLNHSRGTGPGR